MAIIVNNGEGGYDIWATILPPLPSPGLLLCHIWASVEYNMWL